MTATLVTAVRRRGWTALTLLLALALAAVLMVRFTGASADAAPHYNVPHDGQMEASLGVRFTQAALVGDGGLVELRYVVLDTEKATRFQSDTKHPPRLKSERNGKVAWRAALMRQGHSLLPGQSYFILYENYQGAIKRGDSIQVDSGNQHLQHVPVR